MTRGHIVSDSTANTATGRVRGVREDGVSVFRGIPFAAPPVGQWRWRHPEPPKPWFGVREAVRFGSHAPQLESPLVRLGSTGARRESSEDCLTLNVFTPSVDDARRPVMVWIHGGGFTLGSSSQPLYDGARLAGRGDVVVVTLNYRLGALGFLRLADLTGGRLPATGNEGLLDQLTALKWVQENIAEFGGDPGKVTVFGESAGAMCLAALLVLPESGGLMHRAILQSGGAHTAHTVDEANRVAEMVLEKAGLAADPDVLLAADPRTLVRAVGELSPRVMRAEGIGWMPLRPVIDGRLVRELPVHGMRSGPERDIPVLGGTTTDEWRFMVITNRSVMGMDLEGLQQRLFRVLPEDLVPRAIEIYRVKMSREGAEPHPFNVYSEVFTDLAFRVPCERLLDAVAARGTCAFRYLFSWPSPAAGGMLGACHAVDLGFTFGTNAVDGGEFFFGAGGDADRVVDHVQGAWLAFARGGDPNPPGLPLWSRYDSRSRATMEIGANPGMRQDPWRELNDLWAEVPDEILRRF